MMATTTLGRMFAWLQEEVPATLLEAYRRASLPVYEVMDAAEARRLECATEGLNPWTVPPAVRAEFLCAWNAFVLQTLGNEIIDADYKASPATVGFVPSLTAQQVLAFYSQVEEWLTRARQAHANPDFRLDVQVPASLPGWKTSTLEPWSPALVDGLLRAMNSVGDHAAAAMAFLPDAAAEPARQAQLNKIRQIHASAESKARYASDLHGNRSSREVHSRVQPYIREAIELLYQLGQLISDPSLVPGPAPSLPPAPLPDEARPSTAATRPPKAGPPSAPARPGEPGFDLWCLTDPEARDQLRNDPQAVRALRKMWDDDPDPQETLALYAEIQSAMKRGKIAYAYDGNQRLGYFHCCPWSSIYVVSHPVTFSGKRLKPMQRFVYDVGARKGPHSFRRHVLTGNFRETGALGYGPHPGKAPLR
jgi:hypothetical protein